MRNITIQKYNTIKNVENKNKIGQHWGKWKSTIWNIQKYIPFLISGESEKYTIQKNIHRYILYLTSSNIGVNVKNTIWKIQENNTKNTKIQPFLDNLVTEKQHNNPLKIQNTKIHSLLDKRATLPHMKNAKVHLYKKYKITSFTWQAGNIGVKAKTYNMKKKKKIHPLLDKRATLGWKWKLTIWEIPKYILYSQLGESEKIK